MRSSPLPSRTSAAAFLLSLTALGAAQSVPGASFFLGNGAPAAAPYRLVDDYTPEVFFSKFNFFSQGDPTWGHVQ